MTRTLYILRHAHATHEPRYADFDRPLTNGGLREATTVGGLMAAAGYSPARILCSNAQRTRETLAGITTALNHDCDIKISRRLYNAGEGQLLELIRQQEAPSLMLIGHNPGLEELARSLANRGDAPALRRLHDQFPPAALAVIDFDGAWSATAPGTGVLRAFVTPDR